MLRRLEVHNHALIAHVELEFEKGFHVFTGETGSGKSILLGALGLLLGARAESAAVGLHGDRATVEGDFDAGHLVEWLKTHGLPTTQPVVVRREVLRNGRSRAFINDALATATQLKEFGAHMVDLHGQDDLGEQFQRDTLCKVLDSVGGHHEVLEAYRRAQKHWQEAFGHLAHLKALRQSPQGDLSYLQHQVQAIESLHLESLDWPELTEELHVLTHAADITDALSHAASLCDDESRGLLGSLDQVRRKLQVAAQWDSEARELLDRVESVRIEMHDVSETLLQLTEDKAPNPERLHQLQTKHDRVMQAMKRHGVDDIQSLVLLNQSLRQQLEALDDLEANLEEVIRREETARLERDTQAMRLRKARQAAGSLLLDNLLPRLAQLKMPHAQLEWVMTPCTPDMLGADEPSLLFASNPGSALQPMHKVASGGEKSRFGLAMKRTTADALHTPVLVLDEIDTGVSGDVASHMGRSMKAIASSAGTMQVIAVTHLPQVASLADHHWEVSKTTDGATTHVHVKGLTSEERIHVIARMLSGDSITSEALGQATRLLEAHAV
jgi:DNA repair protein RecN (Recombination protein N)